MDKQQIQNRINTLKSELAGLEEDLKEANRTVLWKDTASHTKYEERIGLFNITKARIILTALNNGHKLLLKNLATGDHRIWMNPQMNRFIVEPILPFQHRGIHEDNFLNYVLWWPGDWYIEED